MWWSMLVDIVDHLSFYGGKICKADSPRELILGYDVLGNVDKRCFRISLKKARESYLLPALGRETELANQWLLLEASFKGDTCALLSRFLAYRANILAGKEVASVSI